MNGEAPESMNGEEEEEEEAMVTEDIDHQESCLSSWLDDGNVETHRYYLARRTALEMLKDRGFAVPGVEIARTLPQFREKHGDIISDLDALTITSLHRDDASIKAQVIFFGPNIVKVNSIRAICARLREANLSRLILVVQNKITNPALRSLALFNVKAEIFEITDLLVNITKHELKPKHQVLTPKEKEKLLKEHRITEKQLPRMSEKDAIARYYGYEKGQVVKVTYSGELTQSHVAYRCVW